ncbi:MAG: hypothetical protein AAF658_07530 [Myxococcota bacterium]
MRVAGSFAVLGLMTPIVSLLVTLSSVGTWSTPPCAETQIERFVHRVQTGLEHGATVFVGEILELEPQGSYHSLASCALRIRPRRRIAGRALSDDISLSILCGLLPEAVGNRSVFSYYPEKIGVSGPRERLVTCPNCYRPSPPYRNGPGFEVCFERFSRAVELAQATSMKSYVRAVHRAVDADLRWLRTSTLHHALAYYKKATAPERQQLARALLRAERARREASYRDPFRVEVLKLLWLGQHGREIDEGIRTTLVGMNLDADRWLEYFGRRE